MKMNYRYDPDALISQPWYWRAVILIPFGVPLLLFFIFRRIVRNDWT